LSSDFTSSCCSIPLANGFQAYIAHVNSQGGVDGHKININVMSDNADVATGLANFAQAEASSSLGFLLQASSNVYTPTVPRAIAAKMVESNGGGYQGGIGVFPYVYNIFANLPEFTSILPRFAATLVPNATGSKMAYISYDSALTETFRKPVASAFTDEGWTVPYSQIVPTTDADFSVPASTIASDGVSLIVTDLLVGQLPQFVTQVRADHVTAPIVEYSANIDDEEKAKIADTNVYYVEQTAPSTDTSNPAIVQMRAVGNATHFTTGLDDNSFYTEGYVHAEVLVAALAKCSSGGQTCNRESFNTALNSTTVPGAGLMAGDPGFSPTNHVMTQACIVDHWVSGAAAPQVVSGFGLS